MCPQPITPLTHFAPLIQLWAGICAISFYDKLVKHLVITDKRKKLREDLAFFKEKFNDGSLDEKKYSHIINKIDENLELFEHRVTHLGKFYCGCASGLLLMAAMERN